jgi:hypothetical protein
MIGCFWEVHKNHGGCVQDYCDIDYKDDVFWNFNIFDLVKKHEK